MGLSYIYATVMINHFRVLKNRNYLVYFSGQMLSMTGTWMQGTAQAWLVYKLSHSSQWLGIVMFCMQIPAFLMSPLAGVIADQRDRRKLLILIQALAAVQAMILAVLAFMGVIQLWHITILAVFLGVTNAFDMATRQSFTIDMVGKKDLSSAIALNSLIMNASRIVGPAMAGIMIAAVTESWCFFMNALSYMAVIYALILIKPIRKQNLGNENAADSRLHPLKSIKEALGYVKKTREIYVFLFFGAFVSLVAFPYAVLLPVVAKDILQGDAHTLGWLTSINGLGAVLGSINTGATVDQYRATWKKLVWILLIMGLLLILLGLSHDLWSSMIILFLTGFMLMSIFPTINSSIQNSVHDSMRGRVMSLYNMTFLGAAPVGALLIGTFSGYFGVMRVFIAEGLICVVSWFFLCGILPQRKSGAASQRAL